MSGEAVEDQVERREPWYRPSPLASSATTVLVIALLLTVESLWVFSLIEGPDFDLGDSTTRAWGESFQVHALFTISWIFLHPPLMRRGMGTSGRALLACAVWFTAAFVWVAGAAYVGRDAAAAEGVHPFAWMGWSIVLLAALSPSVLIGALVGERLAPVVEREVRRRLAGRGRDGEAPVADDAGPGEGVDVEPAEVEPGEDEPGEDEPGTAAADADDAGTDEPDPAEPDPAEPDRHKAAASEDPPA